MEGLLFAGADSVEFFGYAGLDLEFEGFCAGGVGLFFFGLLDWWVFFGDALFGYVAYLRVGLEALYKVRGELDG